MSKTVNINEDSSIDNIKDAVFDELVFDLETSGEDYLDETMTYVGETGIYGWEIDGYTLLAWDLVERDGGVATYELEYDVTLTGKSYDIIGKDDTTREYLYSDAFEHKVEGRVTALVSRSIGWFTDFQSDSVFDFVELYDADFSEVEFVDHNAWD